MRCHDNSLAKASFPRRLTRLTGLLSSEPGKLLRGQSRAPARRPRPRKGPEQRNGLETNPSPVSPPLRPLSHSPRRGQSFPHPHRAPESGFCVRGEGAGHHCCPQIACISSHTWAQRPAERTGAQISSEAPQRGGGDASHLLYLDRNQWPRVLDGPMAAAGGDASLSHQRRLRLEQT